MSTVLLAGVRLSWQWRQQPLRLVINMIEAVRNQGIFTAFLALESRGIHVDRLRRARGGEQANHRATRTISDCTQ
jgi:hypothetical protein